MNYIRHLNAFFFHYAMRDERLNSGHISLYVALFQYWNFNRFNNPFFVAREDMMRVSKIGSKNTYHKCIKELHEFGYICYRPSLSKFQKSAVYLHRLDHKNQSPQQAQLALFDVIHETHTVPNAVPVCENMRPGIDTEPVPFLTVASTGNDTVPVPNLRLLIKHKQVNNINEREENTLAQKVIFQKTESLQKESTKQIESGNSLGELAKGSTEVGGAKNLPPRVPNSVHPKAGFVIPALAEVMAWFQQQNYSFHEAQKFFSHYKSNGWLVGGKTPMQDWQSSAQKWMLNRDNFTNVPAPAPSRTIKIAVDLAPDKDYSEKL